MLILSPAACLQMDVDALAVAVEERAVHATARWSAFNHGFPGQIASACDFFSSARLVRQSTSCLEALPDKRRQRRYARRPSKGRLESKAYETDP